jgi:PPOX class probable F420-dependent enzyme
MIILATMTKMSSEEVKRFLIQGTFTGKLATINKDGSSHVVPIWFVLEDDDNNSKNGVGSIILTTRISSTKARNIQRDNRVCVCIDDQTPLFSFVVIYDIAEIYQYEKDDLFRFVTRIAQRYMGKDNAEKYGRRNSTDDEVLVRIRPARIIAEKDIAGWN